MFHKCKALVDDENIEEKLDLGLPLDEKYSRVRFRYSDVTDYIEWIEEDDQTAEDVVKGTIVYTIMGKIYFIATSIDEFDKCIDDYVSSSNTIWSVRQKN